MAYFTYLTVQRSLTEAERTEMTAYVDAQTTAGTTDGNRYLWSMMDNSDTQNVRMWGTIESANGYKSIGAGFNPPIVIAVY
jgi:hypothetical protein